MSIDWPEASKILLTGLVSAIFTGVLAFAAQKIIERWLSRSLEKFKVDLQLAAFEHQTRFTDLHKRRAEAIAEIYKRLARAEKILQLFSLPIIYYGESDKPGWQQVSEKLAPTEKAVSAVSDFYRENKIFLSPQQAIWMDQIVEILEGVRGSVMMRELHRKAPPENEETKRVTGEFVMEKFSEAYQKFSDIYPQIKESLEINFREILGLDISQ